MDKKLLSRAEIEIEKARRDLKNFDIADNPVKEWLAACLDVEVMDVFDDFNNSSEIITKKSNGRTYAIYLSTEEETLEDRLKISPDQMYNHPAVMEVIVRLVDAVGLVYMPIIKTIGAKYKGVFDNLYPKHLFTNYSFVLTSGLPLKQQKENELKIIAEIEAKRIEIMNVVSISDVDEKHKQADLKQINKYRDTHIAKHNAITEEMLKKEAKEADQINRTYMKSKPRLFIHVKYIEDLDMISKPPDMGAPFEEPTHEKQIQDLLEEFNINQ